MTPRMAGCEYTSPATDLRILLLLLMDKFEYELKKQRGETINTAVVGLCKWIPITVICWFAYLSIAALAGRSTLASLGLYLVADLKVKKVLSHIAMFAFGTGGAL